MIRTTRRAAMMGALAVPTVAGLAHWRWKHGERSVLLHDPALAASTTYCAGRLSRFSRSGVSIRRPSSPWPMPLGAWHIAQNST